MTLAPLDLVMICVPLVAVVTVALVLRPLMRSVADFLAAGRCAGRYLICTSLGQMGSAVLAMVSALEVFSQVGFSLQFWFNFTGIIVFMFTLFGVVTYRFRETRCLTFHQFLEVRYSKGMRVFTSFVGLVSGLIGFGMVPAVGARFFVYFCGLPEHLMLCGASVPTFGVLMVALMGLSLFLALTGGQISVMVTDCVEGLISGVFCLVVSAFVILALKPNQINEVLTSGPPGRSYINPFDISGHPDFNGWYVLLAIVFNLYIFRGSAWQQGFNAAAKTAHEGKMAGILATWRWYGAGAMTTLLSIGALTVMHHPDFASQRAFVAQGLSHIGSTQLQTQMQMPMALGVLLVPGVKGAFCAIALFGLLSSQGVQLHSFGSTLLQDVILPLRKTPLHPRAHLIGLRLAAVGVGIFACVFSLLYKPADYLMLIMTLIGAIYLGGVGAIVWGGLYWKKGTTAGAWAAMIVGTSLALAFNLLQPLWTTLQPHFLSWAGHGDMALFLAAHPDKCPFNGQAFSTGAALCALAAYIVVSILTRREDFDMDRMLHRGRYAIADEEPARQPTKPGFRWGQLIGIDAEYSRGDKALAIGTFFYALAWKFLSIGMLLWWLLVGRQSNWWWLKLTWVAGIWIPVVLGVITTIWFTIGTVRDIVSLFRTLRLARRNDADDGTVRDHHNADDNGRPDA